MGMIGDSATSNVFIEQCYKERKINDAVFRVQKSGQLVLLCKKKHLKRGVENSSGTLNIPIN